jgi:DNA repair protein RecN (Recombination protein N)
VDAGIGGRVADVVGSKLHALSASFQVLCITHLPQIAAYADAHYQIEKVVAGDRTHTSVRRLDEAGQVEEIARMLGGAGVTDAGRASAREMLQGKALRSTPASKRTGAKGQGESERAKGESPASRP